MWDICGRKQKSNGDVAVFENGGIGYINEEEIPKGDDMLNSFKVFISAGYNAGDSYPHQIINKPILGFPKSVCTETYIYIGNFNSKNEAQNLISYIQTKFFRFMVMLLKNSQHALKKVYQLVPIQDFSKPWTDAELYEKYGITKEEQAFIDSMIRPMDLEGAADAE